MEYNETYKNMEKIAIETIEKDYELYDNNERNIIAIGMDTYYGMELKYLLDDIEDLNYKDEDEFIMLLAFFRPKDFNNDGIFTVHIISDKDNNIIGKFIVEREDCCTEYKKIKRYL